MNIRRLIAIFFIFTSYVSFLSNLHARSNKDNKDIDLPIREIIAKYYTNFYVGASSKQSYWKNPDKKSKDYYNEFSYNTPENSFKISTVYYKDGLGDDKYKSEEYLYFIEQARIHKQVIRAHGPISPQTNKWSKEDYRTPAELNGLLTRYTTNLYNDLEANKDVVKWVDVVNECFAGGNQKGIGYDGKGTEDTVLYRAYDWFGPRKGNSQWENPWTILGFDTVNFNNQPLIIPKYIVKAFQNATKYAPDIKHIWNDHGKVINPMMYEKLEQSVLYLRSLGLKVDGIGWQAHVEMGWEKNPENIKNLENVIDWCYQNKLEFHITELDVTVATNRGKQNYDYEKLTNTREEQANTFAAIFETMLKKVGKGATAINMWTMNDHTNGGITFSGLFDKEGKPNPSYYKVKELLIKYGKMQHETK